MGLFALLARFLPRRAQRERKPQFAYVPLTPRRLERRRVLDAGGAGLMLEAIPDSQPFVQTAAFTAAEDTNQQEPQAGALNGGPQATIQVRHDERFENESTLAVVTIADSLPLAHQVTIDWGDGSPATVIDAGANQRTVLAVHDYLDDPVGAGDGSFTVTATVTNTLSESATASTTILIKNMAPQIDSLAITSPISENGTATLTGTYSDVGSLDTHTLDIDWNGDGTFDESVSVSDGSFSVSRLIADDDPTATTSDTFEVNVRLRDDDGGQATGAVPLTVGNLSPAITALAITSPVVENGTATLSGRYVDAGAQDTHTLDIDWDGDGTFDQTVSVAGGSFAVSRQILDDNPTGTASDTFNVLVRLQDDDGGTTVAATVLTVQNAAPVVALVPGVISINENGTAVLEGTYSDAGTLDTHELDIDWDGDGTFDETVAVTGGAFTVTRQFLDDDPTGTRVDKSTINVRLRDDDGGFSTATKGLQVSNINPVLSLTTPLPINEDEVATLNGSISDVGTLDTFTLAVVWGDPASLGNLQFFQLDASPLTKAIDGIDWDPTTRQFSIDHQYLDDDPSGTSVDTYTILVAVADDDGGTDLANTTVTVRNVDVTLQLVTDQTVEEGATLDLTGGALGSFVDQGKLDTHTATIDWGDGTSAEAVVITEADGLGTLGGQHIYADNGVYTARVTVFDDDGGLASSIFRVTVRNVDPTLTGVDSPITVAEGELITLAGLGVGLSDPGFDNPFNPLVPGGSAESLAAVTVNWGDGTGPHTLAIASETNGGPGMPTTATFSHAAHAYADNGTYTVTVVARDDDGMEVDLTFTIAVDNVDPTLGLSTNIYEINEGESIDLTGLFADAGFNNPANPNGPSVETFRYSIDWDDGEKEEDIDAVVSVEGSQGVKTEGTFTRSHTYADNDEDNLYTITVTMLDDDGGNVTEEVQVRVLNVNPTLETLTATDVTTQGTATVTVTFDDPGDDTFIVHIDWGDTKPDAVFFDPSTTPLTHTFVHRYDGPPDPLNPSADIIIAVFVTDDDFNVPGVEEIGRSTTQTVQISNPGIGAEPYRIDTTPRVPQLTFPVREEPVFVLSGATAAFSNQQVFDLGGSAGESRVISDRYVELRVIDAEGNEGPGYRLRPEVLHDLPGLFRRLPDNHYAVYVVNTETDLRRLVIEVYVRNGKLIDPGDDSEGTRDRPPTDEETPAGAETVPLEGAPVQVVPDGEGAAWPTNRPLTPRFSRWTALAVGLAASASAQSWANRVDEALAKATAEQWRKLQTHNRPKPKKP